MIDFPKDPRGAELLKLIERLKYERHVSATIDEIIQAAFDDIVTKMLSSSFRDLTQFQRTRAEQLFRELNRVIDQGYANVSRSLLAEMKGYARLEANVARQTVETMLGDLSISLGPSLPKAYLQSIAKLPIQGLNIGDWFDGQANTMTRETRRIIQQGLVEGKPTAEISRRILAPARQEGAVLSRRAKNEARMISRTTVNAVQNDAARASNESLPRSVSDSYEFMAVMDSRTSDECRDANGRVFSYDDPKAIYPPLHINCRSTTRALIRGIDVTIADQKGPITMRGFDSWLKDQTVTDQNDLLGASIANRWRSGTLKLADALDADTRTLTLDQLRERLNVGAGAGV